MMSCGNSKRLAQQGNNQIFRQFLYIFVTPSFLTREYAKRNERVIGVDCNFTYSLAHSLARSITHSLTRLLDPSLRCKLAVLDNSADQCVRLS